MIENTKLVKFKTTNVYGGKETTATVEVTTKEAFKRIEAVLSHYKQASLNDVELMQDGCQIMNVRNHVPELLEYLNGRQDEFNYRKD